MSERITKRDRFLRLLEIVSTVGNDEPDALELAEFINHELELLDKKHTKSGAPTAAQLENEVVKATIASALADAPEPMRATEVGAEVGISVQKATALLGQMVKANTVHRIEEGKVTKFTV
jgi:hypothetical protein